MIAMASDLADNVAEGFCNFMTENNNIQLPGCFDENPDLKARLLEFLASQPATDKTKSVEAIGKFVTGELTWAEIKHIPKTLLKELARVAYLKFRGGDYKTAEILFKGLAVLDHLNWYFRAALGAVFQKQGRFEEAIGEYSMALELNPDEVSSWVNRGQCLLHTGDTDAALVDFDHVLKMSLGAEGPWVKRARTLSQAILTLQKTGQDDVGHTIRE